MIYRNKKDNSITASLDSVNEKAKTSLLIYLTGPDEGKSVNLSNATLKRYWEPVKEGEDNPLNIDADQVNTPYPEPKEKKYVKKPKSVEEYEEKKRKKKYNADIPIFTDVVDTFGAKLTKVNETSQYVKFSDGITTLWRKATCIDIYTTEEMMEKFTEGGLVGEANKDKVRPVHYKISDLESYEKAKKVLEEAMADVSTDKEE